MSTADRFIDWVEEHPYPVFVLGFLVALPLAWGQGDGLDIFVGIVILAPLLSLLLIIPYLFTALVLAGLIAAAETLWSLFHPAPDHLDL